MPIKNIGEEADLSIQRGGGKKDLEHEIRERNASCQRIRAMRTSGDVYTGERIERIVDAEDGG